MRKEVVPRETPFKEKFQRLVIVSVAIAPFPNVSLIDNATSVGVNNSFLSFRN